MRRFPGLRGYLRSSDRRKYGRLFPTEIEKEEAKNRTPQTPQLDCLKEALAQRGQPVAMDLAWTCGRSWELQEGHRGCLRGTWHQRPLRAVMSPGETTDVQHVNPSHLGVLRRWALGANISGKFSHRPSPKHALPHPSRIFSDQGDGSHPQLAGASEGFTLCLGKEEATP